MRSLVSLLILLAMATAPAVASEGVPMAVVRGPARLPGVYVATINPGVTIQKRDILAVQRQGQVMGEVMAMGMSADNVYVLPLASYQGTVEKGDVLQFVRHDPAPVAAAPPPQQPQASTQLPVSIKAEHMDGLPADVPLLSTPWINAQGDVSVTNSSAQALQSVQVTVLVNGNAVKTQTFDTLSPGATQSFQWVEYQSGSGSMLTSSNPPLPVVTVQVMGYQNGNPAWASGPSIQKPTPFNPQTYYYY